MVGWCDGSGSVVRGGVMLVDSVSGEMKIYGSRVRVDSMTKVAEIEEAGE